MMLAFQTCAIRGSVAIGRDDGGVREARMGEALCHARDILTLAQRLLEDEGLAVADIGAVAVSVGPGSYTGMRVGIAAAKVLAWALSIPLVGVGSLRVLANNAPERHDVVVPTIDAKRGVVFYAVYVRRDGTLSPRTQACVARATDIAGRLPDGAALLGSGTPIVQAAAPGKRFVALGEELWLPRAAALARIALEKRRRGETTSPFDLEPAYLRRSEAEELWEKRRTGAS